MNNFSYLLILNACITGYLFLYSFRFPKTPGSRSFGLLMLAMTIYSIGYAFELSGKSYAAQRGWLYFEYTGISFIPAFWLIFILRYLRLTHFTSTPWIFGYLALSFTTLFAHFTNEAHHLFYTDIKLVLDPFPVLILSKGPFYWLHMAWFNLVVLITTVLFINKLSQAPPLYRKQYILMLAGTLAPWVTNTIYLAGLGPTGIDLNPFGAMISGVLLAWGIFFFHLLEVVPLALDNVFSSMRDGVIVLDHMKRVLNFNLSSRRIIPTLTKNSVGNFLLKEIEDIPELAHLSGLKDDHARDYTVEFIDPPGHFNINLSPVSDKKSRTIGYLLLISDITAQRLSENLQKKTEQALRELNFTKDKLISIMAHDLRSPFNMIQSLVSLYQEDDFRPSEEELSSLLGYLLEAANHGSSILENMLLWTRAQTGKLDFKPVSTPFNALATAALQGVNLAAQKKSLQIKSDIPPDSSIIADKNMLEIMLRNLLTNAVKFTRDGGTVGISFSERNDHYVIEVSDTGVGMEQQEIDSLFTATKTVSKPGTSGEKGTGLGLLVCQEFISMHKGNIRVDSLPGKGSIFRITLPKNLHQPIS